MRASEPVLSLWEATIDRLAERYAHRSSAASRGEVSLLAGAGIVLWALLTFTVLVSSPRALPLPRTSLAVGVASDLPSVPLAPAATSLPEGRALPDALTALAGPPPEGATPSPSPTPTPSPRPIAVPVQNALPVVVSNTPRPAPTETPAPTAEPALAPPSFAPPALVVVTTPPVPTPGTPPPRRIPELPPTPTPSATVPAIQVIGPHGPVLTGPRGGPLNTGGVDLYNCIDFTSPEQLLAVFLASGPADPNHLDPQHSGAPCPPEDESQNEPVAAAGPEPAAPPPEPPAPPPEAPPPSP